MWRALRREDCLQILTPALWQGPECRCLIHMKDSLAFKNATGVVLSLPKVTQKALKQTDWAEVQCYDAKRGLHLVKPDTLPDRLFQSKVADVFRGLLVDVVREMLESIVADDVSVLEEAIVNRQKVAVLRHEEMLLRQGQGSLVNFLRVSIGPP